MSDWYDKTGVPVANSEGLSRDIRGEFTLIEDAMAKLPALAGNALKAVRVNSGESALVADGEYVDLVSDQEIDGIKTFLESPVIPDLDITTYNQQAANTKFVVDVIDMPRTVVIKTDSYTITADDVNTIANGKPLIMINSAAVNELIIPANADVPLDIGVSIDYVQYGAGQTTLTGDGIVQVLGTPTVKMRAQYSGVTILQIATDVWYALGDLASS